MIDLTFRVQDAKTKQVVTLFFDNYKDSVVQFINNVLKGEGVPTDAFIQKGEDGIYSIYREAADKGWVMGEADSALTISLYSKLEVGTKYVTTDGDKLALFVKEPDGDIDLKVGNFLNLNDAVDQLNSEEVKVAVDKAFERRDAQKKVEEELARKAKLKALAKNEKEVKQIAESND
jgi:hypothetical protein